MDKIHRKSSYSLSSPISHSSYSSSKLLILIITLLCLASKAEAIDTSITDNTCTFNTQGKLFTLALLNKYTQGDFYSTVVDNNTWIIFNFCDPFVPKQCSGSEIYKVDKAYAFMVNKKDTGLYQCLPFTSDSKTSYFSAQYISSNGQNILNYQMTTKPSNQTMLQSAKFILTCDADTASLSNIHAEAPTMIDLVIYGTSSSACPVFALSSIWTALTDNLLIFGIILFVVGFIMLFFGILMTHLMIFIAAYFLSFAVLVGIFTAFLRPDSSTLAIYFSLLFILFLSTLIAYGLTRLVNVSIFFIGAFFGFVLAALINTIFCKIFGVYSVWSLVVFEIILTIPLGFLTFKYSQEVIVMSTSLVGSYMVVRPFSWIFGGFPNEFTLYLMIEDGQLDTLPWTFFLYLIFIIAIAILGAFYQILKIKRRRPNEQIQNNFITENVEEHIDRIREAVENIITKYAPDSKVEEDYKKMKEMQEVTPGNDFQNFDIKFEEPAKTKERKSKQENF